LKIAKKTPNGFKGKKTAGGRGRGWPEHPLGEEAKGV